MSGIFPNWIQRALSSNANPGAETAWTLHHVWPWAPWVTLLIVAGIAAYVVAIYLREGRQLMVRQKVALAMIRLTSLVILLGMIAQWSISLERTGPPRLVVLMDNSQSMGRIDHYDEKQRSNMESRVQQTGYSSLSRFDLARTLLTENQGEWLHSLADRYQVRLYYLTESGGVHSLQADEIEQITHNLRSAEPNVPATRLGSALQTILGKSRGVPPTAIVLLTDGINTDGPTLTDGARQAQAQGVPLFTVGLGDDRSLCDLKLTDLLADDVVFAGDVINFEFKLTGTGMEGHSVEIQLHEKGKTDILARLQATVGPDGRAEILRIPYRTSRVGKFTYVVEVKPPDHTTLEGSATRQEQMIEVRKEKIRVLLVQDYPSFEFRYLRNMLSRDESVDLHTFLQEADADHAEQDPTALRVFPVQRDELFAYDVVILGDVNPALLGESALSNVAEFVNQKTKGGSLVVIAGPKYMPRTFRESAIAPLLPIDLNSARAPDPEQLLGPGFVAKPTELGLASPPLQLGHTAAQTRSVWHDLPPFYWMLEAKAKPSARVLVEHPTQLGRDGKHLPLIALQYVGAGRVLMHMTDETWRWRERVGDLYFARYWIQMLRYLARSKLTAGQNAVELTTDRREYQHGDVVRLRARFLNDRMAPPEKDGVAVVLEQQGSRTQRVKLQQSVASRGIFEGVWTPAAAGIYHAWMALPTMEGRAPSIDFTVISPPDEKDMAPMNAAELRRAAELTHGQFYTFVTAHHLLEDLPAGRRVSLEMHPAQPLWNTWPVLFVWLILLIAEWLLRKRWGLV